MLYDAVGRTDIRARKRRRCHSRLNIAVGNLSSKREMPSSVAAPEQRPISAAKITVPTREALLAMLRWLGILPGKMPPGYNAHLGASKVRCLKLAPLAAVQQHLNDAWPWRLTEKE